MRNRSERFYSDPGERYQQNYSGTQLSDGVIRLVETDVTDLKEYINSFAESCSIEHILAMCAAGDTSVLSRAQGAYIDTTQLPKTFREMLDVVIDGKQKFELLPKEIKEAFDNNFELWFSDAGSDSWFEKMGLLDKPVETDVKEVNDNA